MSARSWLVIRRSTAGASAEINMLLSLASAFILWRMVVVLLLTALVKPFGRFLASEILGTRCRRSDYVSAFLVAVSILSLGSAFAWGQASASRDNASLSGTVRNSAGEAVGNASVVLQHRGTSPLAATKTGADGTFTFSSVPAATYLLRVEGPGTHEAISREVNLSTGERKQLVLSLGPAANGTTVGPMSPSDIQLEDKPNFTIAGISDWTAAGGHGSDSSLRTSEALARDTAALKSSANPGASVEQLRAAREHAQKVIATQNSADAHRLLGDIDERLGDSLSAVREYEEAARLEPSEENYFSWGAELLLHRGVQPATDVFARGSRAHPTSARMLSGLGAALYASGQYEKAAHRLCEASDLQPDQAAPYLFLGRIQKAAAMPLPCAEQKLTRFAASEPGNALANYYYAVSILRRVQSADSPETRSAAQLLEKATKIDPLFGEAYLETGILHFTWGDVPSALASYRRAITVNPNLAEAHYRLGIAYKKAGEHDKARHEFELYQQLRKDEAERIERERRELKQFVVTLKEQPVSH